MIGTKISIAVGLVATFVFSSSISVKAEQSTFGSSLRISGGSTQKKSLRRPNSKLRYTCGAAGIVLLRANFQNLKSLNCKMPVYEFKAQRNGKIYVVSVNPRTGKIITVKW